MGRLGGMGVNKGRGQEGIGRGSGGRGTEACVESVMCQLMRETLGRRRELGKERAGRREGKVALAEAGPPQCHRVREWAEGGSELEGRERAEAICRAKEGSWGRAKATCRVKERRRGS